MLQRGCLGVTGCGSGRGYGCRAALLTPDPPRSETLVATLAGATATTAAALLRLGCSSQRRPGMPRCRVRALLGGEE